MQLAKRLYLFILLWVPGRFSRVVLGGRKRNGIGGGPHHSPASLSHTPCRLYRALPLRMTGGCNCLQQLFLHKSVEDSF
jgi:hypothetical protein